MVKKLLICLFFVISAASGSFGATSDIQFRRTWERYVNEYSVKNISRNEFEKLKNTGQHSPSSLVIIGLYHFSKDEKKEAFDAFMKSAGYNYPDGVFLAGLAHMSGVGTNDTNGMHYVLKAVDSNHPVATYFLGFAFEKGYGGASINRQNAKENYDKAKKMGMTADTLLFDAQFHTMLNDWRAQTSDSMAGASVASDSAKGLVSVADARAAANEKAAQNDPDSTVSAARIGDNPAQSSSAATHIPVKTTAARGVGKDNNVVIAPAPRARNSQSSGNFKPTLGLVQMNSLSVNNSAYGEPGGISLEALDRVWKNLVRQSGFNAYILYLDDGTLNAEIGRSDNPTNREFVVFVYRGLLEVLHTEDELAGVLGHEMGHGIKNHGERDIARTEGTLLFGALISSMVGGGKLVETAVIVGAALAHGGYRRESEVEADDIGVEISAKSGYSAWGLHDAMMRLERAGLVTLPSGFSSHPPTGRRLQHLQEKSKHWENEIRTKGLAAVLENDKVKVPDINNAAWNRSDTTDVMNGYALTPGEIKALKQLHTRGKNSYDKKNYREAYDLFAEAYSQYNGNFLSALWAARAAEQLKRADVASDWLDVALEINPNYSLANTMKKKLSK